MINPLYTYWLTHCIIIIHWLTHFSKGTYHLPIRSWSLRLQIYLESNFFHFFYPSYQIHEIIYIYIYISILVRSFHSSPLLRYSNENSQILKPDFSLKGTFYFLHSLPLSKFNKFHSRSHVVSFYISRVEIPNNKECNSFALYRLLFFSFLF